MILPLSSNLIPAAPRLSPYVCGFLPVDTRIWAAFKTFCYPPFTGSMVTYP